MYKRQSKHCHPGGGTVCAPVFQKLATRLAAAMNIPKNNPCPEGIQFENGLPVTNAEGHGIGVRSICAIVEKYKGLSDFSVQEGRFILRVSL